MTPAQIAGAAWTAGFRGHSLTTAVAVAMAESNGDPRAQGDVSLEDATWGPSVGLWQIRSYNSELGSGGTRDARANLNPLTNARHAYQVSNQGRDWGPWSTFTSGAYRAFMGAAAAATRTVSANPPGAAHHHPAAHQPPTRGRGRPASSGSGHRSGSTATTGGAALAPVMAGSHRPEGDTRVVIPPSELAALSTLIHDGDTDLHRGRTQVERALDELHRVAANPLVGTRASALLPLGTELLSVMERMARDLSQADALVRSTRTKALRSQSGELHGGGSALLGHAGMPPSVLGLLGLKGDGHRSGGRPQGRHRRPSSPSDPVGARGASAGSAHYHNGHLPKGLLQAVQPGMYLAPRAAAAFVAMQAAARADGLPGLPLSGAYRSARAGGAAPAAGAERKVVRAAERYLGVPYVYGGDSPHGVDCSGLTSSAYRNAFGMNIGRDTTAQLASGRVVGHDQDWSRDRRLLQPGDLIFYGQPGAGGPNAHVVMYVGGGRVVQAPYPGQDVQISPLFHNASADEPFLGVRRYIHAAPPPSPDAVAHGWGRAIDVNGRTDPATDRWLAANAHRFGFYRDGSKSWGDLAFRPPQAA